MAPTCLYACLTTLGHSPNNTANCVLRDLLADLDPLSSWTVFGETWLCQMYQNMCLRGVLLDLGQMSIKNSQWYQFLHSP